MPAASRRITFPGSQGSDLAARLDLPAGPPRAYALFAHCFSCSKDVLTAVRLSDALTARGIAVLRFDFTGQRKQLPLERVGVRLQHGKIHAEDCAECETRSGRIDRIEREIVLDGDLDAATRERMLQIAEMCPVHRTLHSEVSIKSRLKR